MKYHYVAFVSWHIVNQVRSTVKSRVRPRGCKQHVDGPRTGGRWMPVRGERPPYEWERGLGRCGWRDFDPGGSFFKVPSAGPHLQTSNTFRSFVSRLKAHKSATWKKKKPPWPGLILLGQREPAWKIEGRSAPPHPYFKFTSRAELSCFARRVCRLVSVKTPKQVGGILFYCL